MPTNGQRSGGDFGVGRIVQYRCDAGYNLEGPPVRVCQADGQWSGSLPTCSRPSCLPPSRIENGQRIVSPDNGLYSVGTTVTYSCVAGYSLLGTNVLRCLPNGQYSEPAPTCRVSSCSDPGTPANAIREGDEFTVSSVVRFTCRPGYTLRGTEFRVCQEDGSWTGTPPECTVSSCGNPGQPENGIRFGSTFTVGAAVLFTCNDGYRLVGDPRLTCQPNGQWNSARPVCTVNQCTDPGMVPQSTRTVSDRRFITGTVITYTCSSGYTLASGSLRLTCQSTGQYDNRPPVCDVLSCADPGQPDNGERYGDSFRVGATVAYGCNAGYNLVGGLTQQCQPDGQWSETRPTCQAVVITCGNPGLPDNAVRQGDSFTAGDVVSYTCRPGYTPVSGDLSRQCQSNGQWTGVLPTCQVSSTPPSGCSDPGTPRNGQRAVGAQFPNVGAIIRFRCLSGYRITGSIRRVCQANGQWSGTQPTCSTVQCAPVPSIAGALVTIVPDDGRYAAGTVVTVTCGEGFELIGESLLICDDSGRYSAALPQCQVATRPTTSAPVGITGNPVVTSSPSETPITPVWPDPAFTSAPTYVDLNLPASTQPSATYDVYILRPGEPTFSFLASYPVEPSISVQRVPIVPGDTYQFVIRARIGDLTSGNSAPITVPAEDTPATTPGPTDAVTTTAPDIPAPSWPAEAFTAAASYADLRFPGSLTPLLQYDVFIQRPGEPSFSFLATYEATNTISVQRVPLSPGQTYRFVFRARLGPTTSENSIPIIVVTGPGTDPVPDTSPTTSPGLAAPVWPEPSFSVSSTYVDFNLPASNQPSARYELFIQRPGEQSFAFFGSYDASPSVTVQRVTPLQPGQTYQFTIRSVVNGVPSPISDPITVTTSTGLEPTTAPPTDLAPVWPQPAFSVSTTYADLNLPAVNTPASQIEVFIQRPGEQFTFLASYDASPSGTVQRVTPLQPGRTYQFTMRSVVNGVPSPISDPITVTTTDDGAEPTTPSPGLPAPVWPRPAFSVSSTYVDLNLPAASQPSTRYVIYVQRPGEQSFTFFGSYPASPSISVQRVPMSPGQTYQFVIRSVVNGVNSPQSVPISVTARDTTEPATQSPGGTAAPVWPEPSFSVSSTYVDLNLPASNQPSARYELFIQRPGEQSFAFFGSYDASPSVTMQRVTPLQPGQTYQFTIRSVVNGVPSPNSAPITVTTSGGTEPSTSSPELPAPVWPQPAFSVSSTYVDLNLPAASQPSSTRYVIYVQRPGEQSFTFFGTFPASPSISVQRVPMSPGQTYQFVIRSVVNGVNSPQSVPISVTAGDGTEPATQSPGDGAPVWPEPSFSVSSTYVDLNLPANNQPSAQYELFIQRPGEQSFAFFGSYDASPSITVQRVTPLQPGQTYQFTIRSVVNGVPSPISDPITVTTSGGTEPSTSSPELPAPVWPQPAFSVSSTYVDLNLPAASQPSSRYVIYVQRPGEQSFTFFGSYPASPSISVRRVPMSPGQTYQFVIRSVVNGVNSPQSVPISVTARDTTEPATQSPGDGAPVWPEPSFSVSSTYVDLNLPANNQPSARYELFIQRPGEQSFAFFGSYDASPSITVQRVIPLQPGQTYQFTIRSVVNGVPSPISDPITVTTSGGTEPSTSSPELPAPVWPQPAFSVSSTYVDLNLPAASQPSSQYVIYVQRPGEQSFTFFGSYPASPSISVQRVPMSPGQTYQFVIRSVVNGVNSPQSVPISVTARDTTEPTTQSPGDGAPVWPEPSFSVSSTYVDLNLPANNQPSARYELFIQRPGEQSFAFFGSYDASPSITVQRVTPLQPGQTYQFTIRSVVNGVPSPNSAPITVTTSDGTEPSTSSPGLPAPVWPQPAFSVSSTYVDLNLPAASQPSTQYVIYVQRPGEQSFTFFGSYPASPSISVQRVPMSPGQTYQFVIRSVVNGVNSPQSVPISVTARDTTEPATPSPGDGAPVWPEPSFSVSSTYVDLNLPASNQPSARYELFIQRPGEQSFAFFGSYDASQSITVQRVTPLQPGQTYQFTIRSVVNGVPSLISAPITVTTSDGTEPSTSSPGLPAPVWPQPAFSVSSTYVDLNLPAASQPSTQYVIYVQRPGEQSFTFFGSYPASPSISVQRVPMSPGQTYQFVIRSVVNGVNSPQSVPISVTARDTTEPATPSPGDGAPVWPEPSFSVSSTYVDLNLPASNQPSARYELFIQRPGEQSFAFFGSYDASPSITVQRVTPLQPGQTYQFTIRSVVNGVPSPNSASITVTTGDGTEPSTSSPGLLAPVWPQPAFSVSSTYVDLNLPAASQPSSTRYVIYVQRPGEQSFTFFGSYPASPSISVQRVPMSPGQTYQFVIRSVVNGVNSPQSVPISVTARDSDGPSTKSPSAPAPVWPQPAFSASSTYVELNLPAASQPSTQYLIYIQRPGEQSFSFLGSYPGSSSGSVQRIPLSPGQTYQFTIESSVNGVPSAQSVPITVVTSGGTEPSTTAPAPEIPAPVWPQPAFSVSSTYVDLNLPAASQAATRYEVFILRPNEQSYSFFGIFDASASGSVQRIPLAPGETYQFVIRSSVNGATSSQSIPITVVAGDSMESTMPPSPTVPAPVWPKPAYRVTSSYVDLNLPPSSSQSSTEYDCYILRPGQAAFVFLATYQASATEITVQRVPLEPGQTYRFRLRSRVGGAVSADSVPITVNTVSVADKDLNLDFCADPGVPANGLRTGKKPFVEGAVVLYRCFQSFTMLGAATQRCQADGTWSGSRPTCSKGGSIASPPTRSTVVYGEYSAWSAWECSVTCGQGVQVRRRTCQKSSPEQTCHGPAVENGVCRKAACSGNTNGVDHGQAILPGCSPGTGTALDLMLIVHEPQNALYFNQVVNFTRALLSHVAVPPVHVGMVRYGTRPAIEFGLARHETYSSLMSAVKQLTHSVRGAAVATGSALQSARTLFFEEVGARRGARRVVLLITSASFDAGSIPGPEADRLRSLGARVIVVGVGNINRKELTDIASPSQVHVNENIVDVDDGTQLLPKAPAVARLICSTPA
ncbi:mucin-2-like isoform X6 [Sycon ciliatum]|uniref:mucin-2-like isoform X6 n=1 Tax=Sycon ciliatum TaxID=27933 RepID=UPI0031F63C11